MSKNSKISEQLSGAPRSRDSRKKLRRWTFSAVMTLESGEKRGFVMPGFVYGNTAEANATAASLLKRFKEDPTAPQDMQVIPQGHETVSEATKRQLEGLNDQGNLATKAVFIVAEKLRLLTQSALPVLDIVTEAFDEARKHLFPKLANAQEKLDAIDGMVGEFDPPVVAAPVAAAETAETAETPGTDEPKPRRALGIDAVNAILAAPAA